MKTQMLRLALGIAVVGMLLGFGTADKAAAGKGKGSPPNPYLVIIQELQDTQLLLMQTNNDYKGFNNRAITQITDALRHLKGGAVRAPKKTPEDQGTSDAQMNLAGRQLLIIANQLSTATNDPNCVASMKHVLAAIQDVANGLKSRGQ